MLSYEIPITPDPAGYEAFLKCKTLPRYEVRGSSVWTDELNYAAFHNESSDSPLVSSGDKHLFDYQRHVVDLALRKRRYAAFLDCGLGKTAIELAWAHAVAGKVGKVLYLCPLAVMEDIQRFCEQFYGYRMSSLRSEPWRTSVAILNWEHCRDIDEDFRGIILDESSILKNSSGTTRKWLTRLAHRCDYRLAASATPSPNEQAEYATHAVWLSTATTINEFLGMYFRKDGTRWRLKGHAVEPFYRHLRSWCCYIQSPSALGFSDHQAELPDPPDYRELHTSAPSTLQQGTLFVTNVGLGEARRVFAMRADKSTQRFADACASVEGKRSIVWCSRNAEEQAFHSELGGHLVTGTTPIEERVEKIDDFRAGRVRTLVSKPAVLGFGINLPEASDMLYSGYTWSFEQFYQAIRRAHRFGRQGRLKVHIPITDEERPIWRTLTSKVATFDTDVARLQGLMWR